MADWAELIWKGFLIICGLWLLQFVIGFIMTIIIIPIGLLFGANIQWPW